MFGSSAVHAGGKTRNVRSVVWGSDNCLSKSVKRRQLRASDGKHWKMFQWIGIPHAAVPDGKIIICRRSERQNGTPTGNKKANTAAKLENIQGCVPGRLQCFNRMPSLVFLMKITGVSARLS